jgi:hypothetical protein
VKDYFIRAFKVLPGLNVTFGDQLIRVYGTTAVNTGYYTLRPRIASPPEVLEPVRRQRRVDGGAGDRTVSEPALDCPGVVALVGETTRR